MYHVINISSSFQPRSCFAGLSGSGKLKERADFLRGPLSGSQPEMPAVKSMVETLHRPPLEAAKINLTGVLA